MPALSRPFLVVFTLVAQFAFLSRRLRKRNFTVEIIRIGERQRQLARIAL